MRPALLFCLVSLSCTKSAAPVDAGTVIERGTDLRTALTTIFPEYRGAQMIAGRCAVRRVLKPAGEREQKQATAAAIANGFTGEPLMRKPFVLRFEQTAQDTLTLEASMGFSPDEMVRILSAPTSMTSEALAHWIPKLPAPTVSEQFEMEMVYIARSVARADFLVWQLVDGALSSGWSTELPAGFQRHRPDGGAGEVPVQFSLVLRQPQLGAVIELDRNEDHVKLHYRLATYERR